ncbi:YybH family protein [Mangrovitalea sediminis]|uniref:YybH family protein n=1 Tax=Mangrovitalea sediminis TaxID=1982043 RepID=UPI000BE574DE|nr:nuclear transport factor 2 family protein [Mangrovitalea sediminis]
MSTEDEVRNASQQFYGALNHMLNGDPQALSEIWSHEPDVTAMHPIGGRRLGWNEVWKSWEQVAHASSDGKVKLKDQFIHAVGDMAYEVGVEQVAFKLGGQAITGEVRVTNVYQREAGHWKIRHHHTDIQQNMVEVLRRM